MGFELREGELWRRFVKIVDVQIAVTKYFSTM